MKKIFAFLLSTGLLATIGTGLNSCAPSASPDTYNNRLLSAPSSLSLTATDPLQTAGIALACGCSFEPLVITGYGGDTADIHFSFVESLTASINEHTLQAEIYPSKLIGHDTVTAWIALAYNDSSAPYGTMLPITIHATASY